MSASKSLLAEILFSSREAILADWLQEQKKAVTLRKDLISETDLREESERFLELFQQAIQTGNYTNLQSPEWQPMREFLDGMSRTRGLKRFSPSETATFVFSLKQPIFTKLKAALATDTESLVEELWTVTTVLDKLGLFTTE